MYVLNTPEFYFQQVHELAFLVALLMLIAFYVEYKKCEQEIKRDEMIDNFLND